MTIAYVPPAAPAPVVEVADQRGEFPKKRCAGGGGPVQCTRAGVGRGSGRRGDEPAIAWYRVQVGGRINGEFVLDSFNAQFETGGFFGNGLRDRITETAAAKFPGLDVLDFWPLTSPPIAA